MEINKNARTRYKVTLTHEERAQLMQIIKKGGHKSQKVRRALILLNCDEGEYGEYGGQERSTNEEIARMLKVGLRTVERVKKRFVEEGLEVALNGKASSRVYSRKLDGEAEAHLIALCCSEAPEGFSRWTLKLLADKMVELEYVDSVSRETVRRVLKKTS
jgi:transposase